MPAQSRRSVVPEAEATPVAAAPSPAVTALDPAPAAPPAGAPPPLAAPVAPGGPPAADPDWAREPTAEVDHPLPTERAWSDVRAGGVVQRGDEGASVVALQQRLRDHGYEIEVDGKFGPRTQRAVRRLQRRLGVDVDGDVGPRTSEALDGSLARRARRRSARNRSRVPQPPARPAALPARAPVEPSPETVPAAEASTPAPVADTAAIEAPAAELPTELAPAVDAPADAVIDAAVRQEVAPTGEPPRDSRSRPAEEASPATQVLPASADAEPARSTDRRTKDNPYGLMPDQLEKLRTIATAELRGGRTSTCVTTVRKNLRAMKRNEGVPDATGEDPNNPRGMMTGMLNSGAWESLPVPGSTTRKITSPAFGETDANVLTKEKYLEAMANGLVPDGALVFQASKKGGWDYSGGSKGNDVAINRGGSLFNFADMGGPEVYRHAEELEVVVVIPRSNDPAAQTAKPQVTEPTPMDKVVSSFMTKVPKDQRKYAQDNLPLIVEAARDQGITDPDQVAYLLATAQHESRFGKTLNEGTNKFKQRRDGTWSARNHLTKRTTKGATKEELEKNYFNEAYGRGDKAEKLGNLPGTDDGYDYRGRGFVQLTGRRNYREMTKALTEDGFTYTAGGVTYGTPENPIDLLAHPDHVSESPALAARVLVEGSARGIFTGHKLSDHINDDKTDFKNARRVINGKDKASKIAGIATGYQKAYNKGKADWSAAIAPETATPERPDPE